MQPYRLFLISRWLHGPLKGMLQGFQATRMMRKKSKAIFQWASFLDSLKIYVSTVLLEYRSNKKITFLAPSPKRSHYKSIIVNDSNHNMFLRSLAPLNLARHVGIYAVWRAMWKAHSQSAHQQQVAWHVHRGWGGTLERKKDRLVSCNTHEIVEKR